MVRTWDLGLRCKTANPSDIEALNVPCRAEYWIRRQGLNVEVETPREGAQESSICRADKGLNATHTTSTFHNFRYTQPKTSFKIKIILRRRTTYLPCFVFRGTLWLWSKGVNLRSWLVYTNT
jgi:hypothetical protein